MLDILDNCPPYLIYIYISGLCLHIYIVFKIFTCMLQVNTTYGIYGVYLHVSSFIFTYLWLHFINRMYWFSVIVSSILLNIAFRVLYFPFYYLICLKDILQLQNIFKIFFQTLTWMIYFLSSCTQELMVQDFGKYIGSQYFLFKIL